MTGNVGFIIYFVLPVTIMVLWSVISDIKHWYKNRDWRAYTRTEEYRIAMQQEAEAALLREAAAAANSMCRLCGAKFGFWTPSAKSIMVGTVLQKYPEHIYERLQQFSPEFSARLRSAPVCESCVLGLWLPILKWIGKPCADCDEIEGRSRTSNFVAVNKNGEWVHSPGLCKDPKRGEGLAFWEEKRTKRLEEARRAREAQQRGDLRRNRDGIPEEKLWQAEQKLWQAEEKLWQAEFQRLDMTEGEILYEDSHEVYGWLHDNGDLD